MQVQIKFTKFGSNSAFGGFAPGDTMRCSAELAKHLVEDVKVARYLEAPTPGDAPKVVTKQRGAGAAKKTAGATNAEGQAK
jgi:hypothetical protein